jgi:predicted amidohydrolase YtcJ
MMTMEFVPDLVLRNGKVVTVDPEFSVQQAVAVFDGKIVAVGSDSDVTDLAGRRTRVVDLKGKCVVPGQYDNHVHSILAGLDALGSKAKVDIATLPSIEDILTAIKKRADVTPKGEWIGTSCMYRGALKEGRFPTREDLDKVSTEHPIYIFQSGKNVIANSYALRIAGINKDTPNPVEPEGWIARDATGNPTGHLIAGAGDLARKAWWRALGQPVKKWDFLYFDQETQIEAIRAQQAIYHSCGIVGIREMGVSVDELDSFIEAHRRGVLNMRSDIILGLPLRYLSQEEIATALQKYFGPKQHLGDAMLKIGGIKLVVVNDGWWAYSREKLRFLIVEINRQGWHMAIHCNTGGGDEAVAAVLDCLEETNKERPLAGRRITFEHGFGLTNADIVARANALGIVLGANPLLAYYASARSMRMNEIMTQVRIAKVVEPDAWKRTVRDWGLPLRDWFEAGAKITGGTDNPAVVYDPQRPFLCQYSALTGATLAGTLLPGQGISREQMLRMFTINNAYARWQEGILGSIEVGKYADFVVLNTDILECPDEAVKDIQVLETYIDGRLVFENTNLP